MAWYCYDQCIEYEQRGPWLLTISRVASHCWTQKAMTVASHILLCFLPLVKLSPHSSRMHYVVSCLSCQVPPLIMIAFYSHPQQATVGGVTSNFLYINVSWPSIDPSQHFTPLPGCVLHITNIPPSLRHCGRWCLGVDGRLGITGVEGLFLW